jgi:NTE family protein
MTPRVMQTLPPQHNATPEATRPKVAVVLGSGGMKAFAGVPLFEFLEQASITIDLLVGCSGGALICALIAAGITPAGIRLVAPELLSQSLFGQLDYHSLLKLASARFGRFDLSSSFIKPDRMQASYRYLWADKQLEDLRPRTLIQTTDLLTGEGVVLSRGSVADAVYASGAFFPILPPLQYGDRWLADGVYSAPVPVLEAVKRSMDIIIVLDFAERTQTAPQGFLDCFNRYIDNAMTTLKRSQMCLALEMPHFEIVFIEVNFDKPISFRAIEALPAVLAKGEEAVAQNKEVILRTIQSFSETRSQQ